MTECLCCQFDDEDAEDSQITVRVLETDHGMGTFCDICIDEGVLQ